MSATETQPPVTFNPLEEGFVEWPYDQYARLRAADPVHHSDLLHGWVLTRFDDVNAILRDSTISVEIDNATPTPITASEIQRRDEAERGGRTLVLLDDPDHARLRKLIAPPFRPRELEPITDVIAERVKVRVDALVADRGTNSAVEFDLIEDFAYPLPVEIFCQMLGIPEEDHPIFRYWTNCIARSLDPLMGEDERAELVTQIDEMYAFLERLVEEKRANKSDDLMSELIHAEEEGDTLSHEELMAQLMTLYVAGHEPTAGLVGNGMLAFFNHPDQWSMLQEDRSLLRNALSELLRYDGPNQFVRRVATVDIALGDTTIPAGSVIYCAAASANRDEQRWGPSADALDITRADAGKHLQFGAGVHACLGSHLARMQAEAMFTAILDRFEGIELAGEPEWSTRMVIRGLNKLPVKATLK